MMVTVLRIILEGISQLKDEQEQKYKDLGLLVPESYIFTSLVDEEFDTSTTEDASEDDTNVLPEPITSLFDPCMYLEDFYVYNFVFDVIVLLTYYCYGSIETFN